MKKKGKRKETGERRIVGRADNWRPGASGSKGTGPKRLPNAARPEVTGEKEETQSAQWIDLINRVKRAGHQAGVQGTERATIQ